MTSPRPYHHGNLRQELLRVASVALETVGPRNLSLREISRDLGVSHTAPRRHFADKQQLLDALAREGYEQVRAAIAIAAEGVPADAGVEVRLTAIGRAFVGFVEKPPALMELMLTTKHSGNAPHLVEASSVAFAPVVTAFRDAQARGEISEDSADVQKTLIFATLLGLATLSNNGRLHGEPLDDVVARAIRQLL